MTTLADRIQLGSKFLDDVMPGWAGQIDLDELCLDDPSSCVLGQLYDDEAKNVYPDAPFNGYTIGGYRLHDWLVKNGYYEDDEIGASQELAGFERLGIYSDETSDDTYDKLQQGWTYEILGRVQ